MITESGVSITDKQLDPQFDAGVLPDDMIDGLWQIADRRDMTELKRKLEDEEFERLEIRTERWLDKQLTN